MKKFAEIHASGRRLNDEIHRNRQINNPYFVANALESYGIQQSASDIVSTKRLRWLDNYDKDCVDALRKYKRLQRQGAMPGNLETEKLSETKGEKTGKETMTNTQQAAISQFVAEAQSRLQQNQTRKKTRFH